MITAITIDFWNTLFDDAGGASRNASRRSVLREALSAEGHTCDDERVEGAFDGIWEYFDKHWLGARRTPTSDEMVREICRTLDVSLSPERHVAVTSAFERGILEHPSALLPGVADALESLHRRGIRMALISDTAFSPGSVLRELMEQRGVAKYFDGYVFSNETGVAKPHPDAFRIALEKLDASPASSVHIGDIERTDIRGAKDAGMMAILFRGGAASSKFDEDSTAADATMHSWHDLDSVLDALENRISSTD